METLHNGFLLDAPQGTFPLSTDSMVLADFVQLPKSATVLDLGSGCGTLGILLCAKDPKCQVNGVESDTHSHQYALQNIAANQLDGRMSSQLGDLRDLKSWCAPGSYSCCVSNPPYFSGGPVSRQLPQARHSDQCSTADLLEAASWALKYGGDLFLVHKPFYLAELCAHASHSGLEPKRLCLVRHKPDKECSLILLQCRKGAKPGLQLSEICLFDRDSRPTEHYQRIYHL